jgi:mannose-6-phosphate isomerase-like protein (cupin superfamily)
VVRDVQPDAREGQAGRSGVAERFVVPGNRVGQDVLFCLSGSGAVELGSRRVEVQAGEVVWIANEAPPRAYRERERSLDASLVPL